MLTGTWNPGVDQYRIWKFVRGSGNDHGDHPEPHPSAGRVGQPDDLMQKESRTVFNPVRLLLLFLHLRL